MRCRLQLKCRLRPEAIRREKIDQGDETVDGPKSSIAWAITFSAAIVAEVASAEEPDGSVASCLRAWGKPDDVVRPPKGGRWLDSAQKQPTMRRKRTHCNASNAHPQDFQVK